LDEEGLDWGVHQLEITYLDFQVGAFRGWIQAQVSIYLTIALCS
jgi:hypothetical protein